MSAIDFDIFRENLRIIRDARGKSSKQISIDLKLRQMKRIADIEEGRGKPTLEEVNSICNYFGYPIDDMINRKAIITIGFVKE
jgi:transcriptional regulator with XRE-family HTH domain